MSASECRCPSVPFEDTVRDVHGNLRVQAGWHIEHVPSCVWYGQVDARGVALPLARLQQIEKRLDEALAENAELRRRIRDLEERVA